MVSRLRDRRLHPCKGRENCHHVLVKRNYGVKM